MGTRIKFVTLLDLVHVGALMIRNGAVGIWNSETDEVAFRHSDLCNPPHSDRTYLFSMKSFPHDISKVRIEPGL